MYDSKMTLSEVIASLESEVDIASSIPSSSVARWVSSLEQLIYSDILKFYRSHDVNLSDERFKISDLTSRSGEAQTTFDDIIKVYDGTDELVRAGAVAAYQFENDKSIYWQDGEDVQVRLFTISDTLHVICKVRPKIKDSSSMSDTVKVPFEWIELVLSKVRGEAYKIAGDDEQSAKWLNDFNTQLESFKAWVNERQRWYGE